MLAQLAMSVMLIITQAEPDGVAVSQTALIRYLDYLQLQNSHALIH